MGVPLYWMNEQSGEMKEIVLKFLDKEKLDINELNKLKWYIKQWISGLLFKIPNKKLILKQIDQSNQEKLYKIQMELLEIGIDPF